PNEPLLLDALRCILGQARINKIVETGELLEPVLPAKLVEARHAVFAIADDVEGDDVELARAARQPWHAQILEEERMVLQGQEAEALAPHGQGPIRQSMLVHHLPPFSTDGF